ncbi:hypothetical protein [Streptomyces sp. NPDC051219]|uniref:hypothetical protein n=1 Tax=Streptomyces sp. NPDC051219 TaxID=3155283 RepID=UPI003416F0AC
MSRVCGWWGAGAYVVLAGVVLGCTALPPEVDPVLRKAVQPVVHDALVASLEKDVGVLSDYVELSPTARWFCAEQVVEIRETENGTLQVGIEAVCSELASRGGTLVQGTAVRAPWVWELSPDRKGGHQVRREDTAPDGAWYDAWIGRSFSKGGAAVVRHGDWDGTDAMEAQARTHFGLPEDAPVTEA